MTSQLTRSIAIALALTLGAASVSTAFAAARGGPSGPGGPGGPNGNGSSHTSNPIVPLDEVSCNADVRCAGPIPLKKPVVQHVNCDYIVLIDGIPHKDCRRN